MKYRIVLTAIIITIILLGFLIGTPINNNANLINIMINVIAIAFIQLFKNNNKKEKILKSKIDIFVLCLSISPIIPIMFKTYTSLNDSITYCIKYISCLILYFIVYELNVQNKNTAKSINIAVVITILIIIVFGIDILTTNVFTNFLELIGSTIIDQGEIRLSSTFGYGNTFASVVAFGLVLNMGLVIQSKSKKEKFLFGSIAFIYMASLILSYSRIVYIVFVIAVIAYLILIKEKNNKLKVVEVLGVSGIYGIIYSKIFMNILNTGNYGMIWFLLIVFAILCGGSILLADRFGKAINKIPVKKMIYIGLIILLLAIVFILFAINKKADLILFNTQNIQEVVRYIYNVSYENKTTFEFDIESSSNGTLYEIEILEKNKYFDDIKSTKEQFGKCNETKKIEVELSEDTYQIYIYFRANGFEQGQYLKIKRFKINDEEIIINHKYLPTNLVTKITSINFKHKSAWERLVFIQDAFKIISNNWLTGIGGNGWEYMQGFVQDYNYQAKEVHSYPVQVFLEYGIVGIISLISIVIIIVIKSAKKSNFEYITMLISCSIIFFHSLLDFDMTFMFVMYVMFIYLGIIRSIAIDNNEKESACNNYIKSSILLVIIVFMIYLNLNQFIARQILYPKIKSSQIKFSDKIDIIRKCEEYVPYDYDYKMKKVQYLDINKDIEEDKIEEIALEEIDTLLYMLKHEKYYNQTNLYKSLANSTLEIINSNNINNLIDNLYLVYECFNANHVQQRYLQEAYIQRAKVIQQIADDTMEKYNIIGDARLKEIAEMLYNINNNEYDNIIKVLNNYMDCRVKDEQAHDNIEKIENILKRKIND